MQAFVDEHNSKLKPQAAWPFDNAEEPEEESDPTARAKWPFERPKEGSDKE